MLFEMRHWFSYYDGDSTETRVNRLYVLGVNRKEAIEKFSPLLEECKKECRRLKGSDERVEYNIVSLENLVAARDQSRERPMGGGYYTQKLVEIELALEADKNRYRLGICLIPFDE